MARWTKAQVEAFAPDDRSVAAARKLAKPGPWSETGSTDALLWGKCQGSGKKPYQVSVDLTGPAAKCTCPSRKFPCKHGLALLMLWTDGGGVIADSESAADFASEWADGRSDRAAKKAAKADKPVDPEAQAKRLAKRLETMTQSLADFELWLGDVYRQGAAAARKRNYAFWDDAASRLVDGQVPGLADRVRHMPATLVGDDWVDAFLTETGRWYLAARSWARRDALADDDLANLRTYLGWAYSQDDIRKTDAITDRWIVEGVHRTDDGRLQSQRTWLRGESSGDRALALDFAAGGGSLGIAHVTGSIIETPLHLYPGTGARRAIFSTDPTASTDTGDLAEPIAHDSLDSAWAHGVAINPFGERVPVTVSGVLRYDDATFSTSLVDGDRELPLIAGIDPWPLLAAVGPGRATMFGELEATGFRPLSLAQNGQVVPI